MLDCMKQGFLLVCILVASAAPLPAQVDDSDAANRAPCSRYLKTPLPDEAAVPTPHASPACESYKFYAAIDRPRDYVAARKCAWQERAAGKAQLGQNPKAPIAWVVGGSLILADLYANGLGVSRNIPLAMRLACEESDGILSEGIEALEALKPGKPTDGKNFELCDYAATTFEMNFCGGFSLEEKDARRREDSDRISQGWNSVQKSAFDDVRKAFEQYATDVARHETYRGGTIRTVRMIGVEDELHAKFSADLESYEKGQLPSGSTADFQIEDKELNRVYAKAIAAAKAPQEYPDDDVQPVEIQATERSWLKYRDAWVTFARLRYPAATAEQWLKLLTAQRIQRLAIVVCGFQSSDALCTPAILDELEP